MRKLKEVLRLDSLGMSQHQIARSCSISQSTVHEYVSAAQLAGARWPLPENWDDRRIEQTLFPHRPAPAAWRKHPEPDWAKIHQDLQTHRNLTLQLVWQEERESNPEGYAYSRFCDLYRRWLKKLDLVLRQEHRAGEKLFVDYAGQSIGYGREGDRAQIFVATLGASNYTFACATAHQRLVDWTGALVRALEYIDGVPALIVPDNAKALIADPDRYEPRASATIADLARHYGTAVLPARPYRPQDKGSVSYYTSSVM